MPGDFALPSLRRFDPATGDVTLVPIADASLDELRLWQREHAVFCATVREASNAECAVIRAVINARERDEEAVA
jgi:hypothetical protein